MSKIEESKARNPYGAKGNKSKDDLDGLSDSLSDSASCSDEELFLDDKKTQPKPEPKVEQKPQWIEPKKETGKQRGHSTTALYTYSKRFAKENVADIVQTQEEQKEQKMKPMGVKLGGRKLESSSGLAIFSFNKEAKGANKQDKLINEPLKPKKHQPMSSNNLDFLQKRRFSAKTLGEHTEVADCDHNISEGSKSEEHLPIQRITSDSFGIMMMPTSSSLDTTEFRSSSLYKISGNEGSQTNSKQGILGAEKENAFQEAEKSIRKQKGEMMTIVTENDFDEVLKPGDRLLQALQQNDIEFDASAQNRIVLQKKMKGQDINKIVPKAVMIFKQLALDDQPYLNGLYREKSFTRHVAEFMDEEDEEQARSAFPFQKQILAAAKTSYLEERWAAGALASAGSDALLPGIRKTSTSGTADGLGKTATIAQDIDDLIMEDSQEDDSLASSSGSSDIDWDDL